MWQLQYYCTIYRAILKRDKNWVFFLRIDKIGKRKRLH